MRQLEWYVFRIKDHLFRIKCEPFYMQKLYLKSNIDEFMKCSSKEEAIELCSKFNRKRRNKNGD